VNVLRPSQRATVVTLLERGTPRREIACITCIDRRTIKNCQRRWQARRIGEVSTPQVATGSEACQVRFPLLHPGTAGIAFV
jgi:transposase